MKYRTHVDLAAPNSSQTLIAQSVQERCAPKSRVLDLGCAAGDLGEALSNLDFIVTGVESDPAAIAVARGRLANVIQTDLSDSSWVKVVQEHSPREGFDALCLGDVLEHLPNPQQTLREAVSLLAPDGIVVISIPNVAHGALRLALLQGRWNYTSEGLLDATHLHFFTRSSAIDLVHRCGLGVLELQATCLEVLGTEVSIDDLALPGSIVEWVRDQDGACDYQYIITCSPQAAADAPVPPVKRASIPDRPFDEHAERRRLEQHEELLKMHRERLASSLSETRNDGLTTRDAIIGLEAQVSRLKKDVDDRDHTLHEVRTELIATHARLAAALHDAQTSHRRLGMTAEGLALRAVRKAARKIKGV